MVQRLAGRFEARPMAAINMTPLVPVLLAVFTVVAATAVGLGKPVNLYVEPGNVPPPYEQWRRTPPKVFVSLERDGVYVGEGRAATLDQAISDAGRLTRANGSNVVMLRADSETSYADVMAAVRRLNAAGLKVEFIFTNVHAR